ncbi:hypothetical protein [Streptosporangium sp. NPDC049078]|uniref:helix-turn-helix domain-containing protein n=1 Tax=Streptosporangium sp. NPDC049078 TaxID=3155767 RepID=UPI00342C39CE
MTPDPADNHKRLASAMSARREELHMTWVKVAESAGITTETLRAIRHGDNSPSTLTKRGIEAALQWEPGSIDMVLSGGEPTPTRRDAVAAPETVIARAGIPAPAPAQASTPERVEAVGVAQVDAILAALRAELREARDEAQRRDEEQKAALAEMAAEIRALRENRGA